MPDGSQYVVVAGNVGVGKTSLLLEASRRVAGTLCLIEQPEDVLVRYFDDPARYAFVTQMSFMLQYLEHAAAASEGRGGLVLQERGVDDGFVVFGGMRLDRGWLDTEQQRLLARVRAVAHQLRRPTLFLLLDASPHVLVERLRRRAAVGDDRLLEADLFDLRVRYDRWFHELDKGTGIRISTDHLEPPEVLAQLLREVESRRTL